MGLIDCSPSVAAAAQMWRSTDLSSNLHSNCCDEG